MACLNKDYKIQYIPFIVLRYIFLLSRKDMPCLSQSKIALNFFTPVIKLLKHALRSRPDKSPDEVNSFGDDPHPLTSRHRMSFIMRHGMSEQRLQNPVHTFHCFTIHISALEKRHAMSEMLRIQALSFTFLLY